MNKKLWEASHGQKKKSLLSSYEQFISKKFKKRFNQKYDNILKWSIENPGNFWSSIWAGDYISEFKIENADRPNKGIIYPIAILLLIIFGYLNYSRKE